jgi:glycosyltransferase involved in cell wall biosynthesis
VTVLAAEGSHEKPIAFSRRGWRTDPGFASRVRRTPIYLRAFDRWLTANPPDVVHANSVLTLPEATIARVRGFPIVVQIHELLPSGRKRDLSLRWAAAVADVLVGVSEPVSTMLRQRAARTPVLTIHNGVPAAMLTRPPDDGEFVVGSIGHISRTKGTDIFLEAARLALAARPELRFEHVGPGGLWGDDGFDARVEELAAAPGLREAVRMCGRQSGPEALCRWSVFVLSSRQDAFPLSTLEAMAAGVPVIACAVGGIPEQIEHLESGILVAPDDPAVISEWIVRLYDDRHLRTELAARARQRVHQAFPMRAQADALERGYRHAIARKHRDHLGFPAPRRRRSL